MKKSMIIIASVAALCIGVFGGTALVLFLLFAPVTPQAETQTFVVSKGDSITSIANKLTQKRLLRHPLSLRLLVKLTQPEIIIQPGSYKLSPHMSPREILQTLESETQDVWVTLKEGWRVEEIAAELDEKLDAGFDAAAFIELAAPVEGYLFPDTYLLSKDMSAAAVFSLLTKTFESRYEQALVAAGGAGVLSRKETVILASLVQREGKSRADMEMVAGILLNRLRAEMPLQVDATLQYARGYDAAKQTWWATPRSEDRAIESPYNTYRVATLPPTAICNPGVGALAAALKPAQNDFLFYLHEPDGTPHYARDFDTHRENIATYLR